MWFDWFFCFLLNTLRSWDLFHFTILLRISTYIKRTSRRINRFLHNIDRHYPRRVKNESNNEWTRFLWLSPQSWNNMENSFSNYRIFPGTAWSKTAGKVIATTIEGLLSLHRDFSLFCVCVSRIDFWWMTPQLIMKRGEKNARLDQKWNKEDEFSSTHWMNE